MGLRNAVEITASTFYESDPSPVIQEQRIVNLLVRKDLLSVDGYVTAEGAGVVGQVRAEVVAGGYEPHIQQCDDVVVL